MAVRPCSSCAFAPGWRVCRHCAVAVLRGEGSSAGRWVGAIWGVSLLLAGAGLCVVMGPASGAVWAVVLVLSASGGLVGAVFMEQARSHLREELAVAPVPGDRHEP